MSVDRVDTGQGKLVCEFLSGRGITAEHIVAAADAATGFGEADTLLAVGSVPEGLGNQKSDFDLLLLTDRTTSASARNVAFVVNGCVFDICILSHESIRERVSRLKTWLGEPWQLSTEAPFSLDDRRMLHRLLHCWSLRKGNRAGAPQDEISLSDLARLKLQIARHAARTFQVDMMGYSDAQDYASLTFAAQELLGHAADGLTAALLLTNPLPKWRLRLLDRLGSNWDASLGIRPSGMSAPELYWLLHRAPERPTPQHSSEHALRVATFARAALMWAERELLRPQMPGGSAVEWRPLDRRPEDIVLPALKLDVDFADCGNAVKVGRLNDSSAPLTLSLDEFRIALLFDGVTTSREADFAVCGDHQGELGCVAEAVLARVEQSRLCSN